MAEETIQGGTMEDYAEYAKSLAVNIPEITWKDVGNVALDFTPIIGDIKGGYETVQMIGDELSKEDPNYYMIGALGGLGAAATIIGLVPGVGDLAKTAIMAGARRVAQGASDVGRGALDFVDRIEVDPNTLGSLGGNVRLRPQADLSARPDAEQIIRSQEGYGALKNLPKPTKPQLDPAGIGGTKLPAFVEDIEYKTTDKGILIPRKEIDISELQGRVLTPAYGDRTYAGGTLDEIAGVKLDQPVEMQGGNQFMREGEGLWASEKQAMETKAKAMSEMDDPLMVYTAMSGQSGDFSRMMSNATMGIVEKSKITKKAAKSYDDRIKETVDPNWVGILNPNAREYIEKMAGTDRRLLWQEMDADKWKKQGFPDVGVIRASITEPELLTSPSFTTGRSIGSLESTQTFPSTHQTYNTEVIGKYEGALPKDVPGDLVWRDFFENMGQRLKETGKANPQRAFLMTPSIQQKVDQQMVDEVSAFTQALKDRR